MHISFILPTIIPALCAALIISIIPPIILSKLGKSLSLVATGLLLTLALNHLLPEAIESSHDIHIIGMCILLTILALIALEMFFNTHHHDETCPVCHAHQQLKHSRHKEDEFGNVIHNDHCQKVLISPVNIKHNHSDNFTINAIYPIDSNKRSNLSSPLYHFSNLKRFYLHSQDIEHSNYQAQYNEIKGGGTFKRGLSNGGAPILLGTIFHALGDGVVIVSAFNISSHVGFAVTLAILAHEIPQQLSNYVLMLNFGMTRLQAYCVNIASALSAIIGGSIFSMILDKANYILPYALAITGGSFIYVALTDILPRLNKSSSKAIMLKRFLLLSLGVCIALILSSSHHHQH